MRVCLLAGGTGGALLAAGLQALLEPGDLTVVTNTGDDFELWGLHISPDTDSVVYRLAGLFNDATGWGVTKETFAALKMLERYGEDTWFGLGDRDLATHILRTHMMDGGLSLTQATAKLCQRLGLATRVLPMSNDAIRTRFRTEAGTVDFQDYFVRLHCGPAVQAIELDGIETARPTPEVLGALAGADLVIIGPSNPLISVGPILALAGDAIPVQRTAAISPIVGGRALKGPTSQMMLSTGRQPTCQGVAREYAGRARWFVIDSADSEAEAAIARLGYEVLVMDIVMGDTTGSERLARAILSSIGG